MRDNFIHVFPISEYCMSKYYLSTLNRWPLRVDYTSHWALPQLRLYYESVRLPKRHTASSLFSSSLAASVRNASVLPSSNVNSSFARYGLRPRHVGYALAFIVHTDTGFQTMKSLTQCNKFYFEAHIPSRFRIVADKHLSRGFAWFVTSPYARFRSGLVASLWPCWIVQLAYISFSWRTHGK